MNDLTKYNENRDYMRTFDRLEWRSKTAIGWLIREKTGAFVNHTGVIIKFKEFNRVFTSEALGGGIDLNRLSDRLIDHKGECFWYPLKPEYEKYRISLGQKMLDWEAVKYDYFSLFKQILFRVTFDASKLFCSEAPFLAGAYHNPPLPFPDEFKEYAPRPGYDMDKIGWWQEGVRIL